MRCVDVAVLGGGPAGLAAATMLVRQGRSVLVLDRERKAGPRVGETIGPEVPALLKSLEMESGFDAVPAVTFLGTRSAWGSAVPFERSAILNPLGEGRHISRTHFDAWLTSQARTAGVSIHTDAGLEVCENETRWLVRAEEVEVSARFLIKARGRSAPGPVPSRRWIAFDRLIGVVGWTQEAKADSGSATTSEPELLIESAPNGWWYSALQPDGGLVAAYMTDADLLHVSRRSGLADYWREALLDAPLTAGRVASNTLSHDLEVRRADSGFSCPDRGKNWRAIGDAAFARDPLAGTGIANALRSGIRAAQEIHQDLEGIAENCKEEADNSGVSTADITEYLNQRAGYYGLEQRWPDSPFWARRHPINLAEISLFLHPETTLAQGSTVPSTAVLASIEALLPPRALRDFLRQMQIPTVAHAALSTLRQLTGPIGDIRLLAAVQRMVEFGVLLADPTP